MGQFQTGDWVSFGAARPNRNDAAVILLLDHLLRSRFSEQAIFLPEALILLGLELDTYLAGAPAVLARVLQTLSSGLSTAPEKALAQLRQAVKDLGTRRPRVGSADSEQRQISRLASLASRLSTSEQLVPGMTIHQAKGREWNNVGIILSPNELARLGTGLDREAEVDRTLYVALTRARDSVTQLAG